ncbi:MAG: HEAT repeat domain-containing protein [Blastocatellia bacterium]|nr:HEAT repeat domain-containing protein [Blastocatellia bacterium]
MKKSMLWGLVVLALAVPCADSGAQDRSARSYTQADFVKVEGGALSDRVERAFRQFKGANQGDSLWLAYHFPARAGVSVGPFAGMIYYDEGIRLERKENPATAAIFLLTDGSGTQPRITRVKLLDLSEPYVFEKRPVYWLGDVDAAQSIAFLEGLMRPATSTGDLAAGALRAISSHDSPRAIALLRDLALKDANAAVQASAVSSLSRIRTEQGAAALVDLYDAV